MESSNNTFNVAVVPREQHSISRRSISENALKVLYRLNKSGYEAYLVGGGVRDLLLDKAPKDFDIATNATPEQVKKLFRNCRLIGRRFRLAHIMFGKDIIEVATFRGKHDTEQTESGNKHALQSQSGMLLRDNVYGTIEQDAQRRDFTINSLYYCISDFTIRDYCNGLYDLQHRIIRLIGDPETRYREDPVRMLRALRFVSKLDMTLAKETEAPITKLAHLLKAIPAARLFDESLKLLQTGNGYRTYQLLRQYQLMPILFPAIARGFTPKEDSNLERILTLVLKNTDTRINHHRGINPAFLFATMLWYPLIEQAQYVTQESGLHYNEAFSIAINDILAEQCKIIAIPRQFTQIINDIWFLQSRLAKRHGKKALKILEHPKYRAAYDLFVLRAEAENSSELSQIAMWWNELYNANDTTRSIMIDKLERLHQKPYRRFRAKSPTNRVKRTPS